MVSSATVALLFGVSADVTGVNLDLDLLGHKVTGLLGCGDWTWS